VLIASVRAIRAGERPTKPAELVAALGVTAGDESLDPGYRAQFMLLPSESDIARVIARDIDPLAIYRARKELRKAIGTQLGALLLDLYRRHADTGLYSPAPAAAGRRALRNAALGHLTIRGRSEDVARVAAHFTQARNATDEVSALAMLAELRRPERAQAFARFHKRWQGDHLMIDNWFAYQAASPLPTTLATVKKLTHDPLFSIKNPNKVRALIGTFAAANPVNFNRADGKGYEFVADRVLEIDRFNPQIAARILSAFRSWKALEPERRKVAKKAMQRIAKTKPLSHDVFEIVSKMLE
jgi:aminopeptidase N